MAVMRVFPMPVRALALAGALSLVLASGAGAVDDTTDSAAAIQIKLVQGRQSLNAMYERAAAASEQLNGAIYRADQARAETERNQHEVAIAAKGLKEQKDAVAALTVQDLQSGTGMARLGSLFQSAGPVQLLDRAAAYSSTQEAMAAHIDSLTASTVVYDSAIRRADKAAAAQHRALADQVTAKAAIEGEIAAAEAAQKSLSVERTHLLAQLAVAQHTSVKVVTKRQNEIDRTLDQQAGMPPAAAPPAEPRPVAPRPAEPQRVVPKPADPEPATPPNTTPAPKPVEPPPASLNRVETAIAFAKAQLGDPYQWGAAGPDSWDCSGLTMQAYAAAGVRLPHYGGAQYTSTKNVPVSGIKRGDLLFWSNGSAASIYHVALYLGDGQMIQAPRTGRNVEIVPLSYWIRPDLASRPG